MHHNRYVFFFAEGAKQKTRTSGQARTALKRLKGVIKEYNDLLPASTSTPPRAPADPAAIEQAAFPPKPSASAGGLGGVDPVFQTDMPFPWLDRAAGKQ